MNFKNIFFLEIQDSEKETLRRSIIIENLHRAKISSLFIIIIEAILSIIDISNAIGKVSNSFNFSLYLLMYMIMIFINVSFLIFTKKYTNNINKIEEQLEKIEVVFTVYITLMMVWGSLLTLFDQKLYGQVIVYMINMISCSILYYLDSKKILISYSISIVILFLGLPFFQDSYNVLIGHYINLFIFTFHSWFASRIIYTNYCSNYLNEILVKKSNILLEEEIKKNYKVNLKLKWEMEKNHNINIKLKESNKKLKKLSFTDELTRIPNRRRLNDYIEFISEHKLKKNSLVSVIFIDVDNFKLYNDNYGHNKGDEVLNNIAQEMNSSTRKSSDFVARLGGEEFVYIAVNTDEKQILTIAQRLRLRILDLKIPHNYSVCGEYISISLGTSTVRFNSKEDIENAIMNADKALYNAKMNGRNCVANY